MLPETEWIALQGADEYAPPSLAGEGFIHFSESAEQLLWVANALYSKRAGSWMVLVVDEERVRAPLRREGADGAVFPHLYGCLNVEAIERAVPFPRDDEGAFVLLSAL